MVRDVKQRGISVIHWIDHGRLDGGFWDVGSYLGQRGIAPRLAEHVPDPLGVVCDEAHQHGMRVIAVIKPWDLAFTIPWSDVNEPNPGVRLPMIGGSSAPSKFIRESPYVRSRLHPSLIPDPAEAKLPIRTLRVWHDEAQLPASPEVTLYISYDNAKFEPYRGPMRAERVTRRRRPPVFAPAPAKRFAEEGEFACIELTDLEIDAPFVAVQFDGPSGMRNTIAALIEILGPEDQPLSFTYGFVAQTQGPGNPGDRDWRTRGIAFEVLHGSPVTRTHAGPSRSGGRFVAEVDELKVLGIGRGRNEYLFSPIEYAYPEVQRGVLQIISEALDSGVDGIDLRQSSHCESLDWENYGYNEPVMKAYREQYGVDPVTEPVDCAKWQHLRGRFFDEFLKQASELTRSRGAMFLVHLQFLMNLPAEEPTWLNVAWHWRDWLTSGLVDGATFKTGDADDEFYREALAICEEHELLTIFTRKPTKARLVENFTRNFAVAAQDGFDAINLYELAVLARLQTDGRLRFEHDELWELVAAEAAAG